MTRFFVRDVLESTGGLLLAGDEDRCLRGVSTDTRTLRQDDLFLALSGPNFDGNRFEAEARSRGAGAIVLRAQEDLIHQQWSRDVPVVLHEHPRRALADLATWHRSRLFCPVIGITGSSGKTTTKNILVQLLSDHLAVVGSPSSFNNDVGVPHTLLLAEGSTEALVVEMGTNQPGEIGRLCRIARPTAGIITNVGASHLEGLGSTAGVAREKSDLFASLPDWGFGVLNLDGSYAEELRACTAARVISVSVEGDGELNAVDPLFHGGGTSFRLEGDGVESQEITSPLLGIHNIHNLLTALAACKGLGMDLNTVLPAVQKLAAGSRRLQRLNLGEIELFDDSYNANPDSAKAGVRVLAGLHGVRRRVLILGDMLELGEQAPELHHTLGREAAEAGLECLIFVGELARASAAGALEAGAPKSSVHYMEDADEACSLVPPLLEPGDVLLVKASRAVGLDRLVENLRRRYGGVESC